MDNKGKSSFDPVAARIMAALALLAIVAAILLAPIIEELSR